MDALDPRIEPKLPVPALHETEALDHTPEHTEVVQGIRTWHSIRQKNRQLQQQIEELRDYTAKLEAHNNELGSQLAVTRSELEYYRLLAIEGKTHLRIIQGHVNAANERLRDVSDPQISTGQR